jgi:hypothetical protein
MPKVTGPGLSTTEAARAVGASYRQLWGWASKGLIPGLVPSGTGRPLRWLPGHVHAARLIKARRDLSRLVPVQQREGERLSA